MFRCYVLRSEKTGRRYVGSCEDLAERIRRDEVGDSNRIEQSPRRQSESSNPLAPM